jgi:hypothetical protein
MPRSDPLEGINCPFDEVLQPRSPWLRFIQLGNLPLDEGLWHFDKYHHTASWVMARKPINSRVWPSDEEAAQRRE